MTTSLPANFRRLMATALLLTGAAIAADTTLDNSKSRIVASYRQEGVSVEAPFQKFSGRIVYDPTAAASATATIEVVTGSLDVGSDDFVAELAKPQWFDTGAHPTATFVSTAIKPLTPDRFEATGTLTLKGKTETLTVPVSVSHAGGQTQFDGSFDLLRSRFGIGDPQWNDVLDDKVHVSFHLVQTGK